MRHICQTMHIEISCGSNTERKRERERMILAARPPVRRRLSERCFSKILTPFRRIAPTYSGPRLRAYLWHCKIRIRSDDDSPPRHFVVGKPVEIERERKREREDKWMRVRVRENANYKNSANRRWQIYRACFIGAICTQRDAGGLQCEGGKMGDGMMAVTAKTWGPAACAPVIV